MHVVLATCAEWPDLSVSDRCLADELEQRGHEVRALAWNAAPVEQFAAADMIVLRSNWDYHHDLDGFREWLTAVEDSPAVLHNSADLVRAFLDKSYLVRLDEQGIRVPRTLVTTDFELDVAEAWLDDYGFDRVVIKPAWGASGHDVELVSQQQLPEAAARWRQSKDRRPMLVQEFMPQIRSGELSLVFFGGAFSHALIKVPAADDFRVNGKHGGATELHPTVDPAVVEFATRVEASLPEPATYARIDVVSDGSEHIVIEVEVNEPAIGLHLAPGSAARFADALLG